jgi:hypothetical protein
VNVTGVDIAPNLVQRAQARANAEGLNARIREGEQKRTRLKMPASTS